MKLSVNSRDLIDHVDHLILK